MGKVTQIVLEPFEMIRAEATIKAAITIPTTSRLLERSSSRMK